MKDLSSLTKNYILSAVLVALAVTGWEMTAFQVDQFPEMIFLAALASLALIFKVEGSTQRSHYNISFLVFGFSLFHLGPPATIGVIIISNLIEWTRHRYPWYIQTFNISSYIISLAAAGAAASFIDLGSDVFALSAILIIFFSRAVFTLINHLMVGVVIWLARGQNFRQSGIFAGVSLMIDYTW